jgi:hypothetical protein
MLPFLELGCLGHEVYQVIQLYPRRPESSFYLTLTLDISLIFSVHLYVPYQYSIHFDHGLYIGNSKSKGNS